MAIFNIGIIWIFASIFGNEYHSQCAAINCLENCSCAISQNQVLYGILNKLLH